MLLEGATIPMVSVGWHVQTQRCLMEYRCQRIINLFMWLQDLALAGAVSLRNLYSNDFVKERYQASCARGR